MKRIFSLFCVAVLLLALLASCGSQPSPSDTSSQANSTPESSSDQAEATPAPEPATLRLAYHPHVNGFGAVLAAQELGYFADENLEVEFVQFTSGAPELAAMASGDIALGFLGTGAHGFAPQGQCVFLSVDTVELGAELLATKASGITSVSDLKGKTIGCIFGSTSEMFLNIALEQNGLSRDDVEMVNMDASGLIAAYMSNHVDAISTYAPYPDQLRIDIGEENVISLACAEDYADEYVFCNSWVVTPEYLAKNEDVVVRFLKAYLRGCDYRAKNPEECVKMVAKELNLDETSVASLVERTNYYTIEEVKEKVEDGTFLLWYNNVLDMFYGIGTLDRQYDAADYFPSEYLLEAIHQLGY